MWIIKVMKHIRQSFHQHASRSFDVGKDPAFLWLSGNESTVAVFPFSNSGKEPIVILFGSDISYFSEDILKPLRVRPPWIATAPA
jgi:hypothetical protein